jgi:hypothetical protein
MSADSRVVDAVKAALTEAWPDLTDDTVHLDQLAAIAADAAQLAVARILLGGEIPKGAPAELRPSDETLIRGAAITTWLYTVAALDRVQTEMTRAIATARADFAGQLRSDNPFELLLAMQAHVKAKGGGKP